MHISNTPNWERIGKGLIKYNNIMELFQNSQNVKSDTEFQKRFKGFYRLRRNDAFCEVYFKILQDNREDLNLSFETVLKKLFDNFNRIEASFSSKLIATINPNLPVWDSIVLNNLKEQLISENIKKLDKMEQALFKYNKLKRWYSENLNSDNCKLLIDQFDRNFPKSKITDTKKIDLILWQSRE